MNIRSRKASNSVVARLNPSSTLIHERLLEYALFTKILPNTQFGFIPKRRREDSIFMLDHDIQRAIKGNTLLYTVFIDLTKAFDKVPHELLILKLKTLNIQGHMLEIIRNMYQNTTIHLKSEGERSDNPIPQEQGVCQGDPLSPLLYNLFVADLANAFGKVLGDANYIGSYADDTFFRHKDPAKIQQALDILERYCKTWNLTVNTSKTHCIVFRRKTKSIPADTKFTYAGEFIKITDKFTYLSLLLHEHGDFNEFIAERIKATKTAAARFRGWYAISERYVPVSTALLFINSLVISQATELCSIWGPTATQTQLDQLQTQMVKCYRQIIGTGHQSPSILIEAIIGTTSIQNRIELQITFPT